MTTPAPQTQLSGHSMGTTWSVRVAAALSPAQTAQARQALTTTLDTVVAQMSHWESDSLLSQFNQAPAGWYQLPEPFYTVMACALDVAQLTQGAYDPTVGELSTLWGFGPHGAPGRLPDTHAVQQAHQRMGWQRTRLDAKHQALWQPGGLTLDFSAIAKGYAVDAMAQALAALGHQHYLVELGGELAARGQRDAHTPWHLQIESPGLQDTRNALPIHLQDQAVATSGDYRRFFMHNGHRYAHTLDPRNGRPLTHAVASVSVVHAQCMMADALSTALMCMGLDTGLAFARQHQIAALFMVRDTHDLRVEWTDAFLHAAHPG